MPVAHLQQRWQNCSSLLWIEKSRLGCLPQETIKQILAVLIVMPSCNESLGEQFVVFTPLSNDRQSGIDRLSQSLGLCLLSINLEVNHVVSLAAASTATTTARSSDIAWQHFGAGAKTPRARCQCFFCYSWNHASVFSFFTGLEHWCKACFRATTLRRAASFGKY